MNTELSKREKEVLRLLFFSYAEIAEKLFIQPSTAKTHANRILEKLNCRNKTAAVIKAIKQGLIDIEEVEINERS